MEENQNHLWSHHPEKTRSDILMIFVIYPLDIDVVYTKSDHIVHAII